MEMRSAIVAALLVTSVVCADVATAAPQACRLVEDVTGDVRNSAGADPRQQASLDLTSADVSSDAQYVTATIRVRELSAWRIEGSGVGYEFGFTLGKFRYLFEARNSTAREGIDPVTEPDGPLTAHRFFLLRADPRDVGHESWRYDRPIAGYFDEDNAQIVMSAPLTALAARSAHGRALATDLRVAARNYDDALVVQHMNTVDDAASTKSYRLGTRSCAPVFRYPSP